MTESNHPDERMALRAIIDSLHALDDEVRLRLLRAAATFFGLHDATFRYQTSQPPSVNSVGGNVSREPTFSHRDVLSPKEFLSQKEPSTDVERVACLAYYLTHYRDTPHFRTIDISKLNTEAAQLKFSNPAVAVANAINSRFLALAGKGNKQMSAIGDRLVDALPDREAVKSVMAKMRARRNRKKGRTNKRASSP